MAKYIERYIDTKRPIKLKDKVKIIEGHYKGKIGKIVAKDPSGLSAYGIRFENGDYDCFMSYEFINADEKIKNLQVLEFIDDKFVKVRLIDLKEMCICEGECRYFNSSYGRFIKIYNKRYYIDNIGKIADIDIELLKENGLYIDD
jgi:hypothetical protein